MTATVWTTEQVKDIFADAYYGAAKSGADMRRVADALEPLRDPLSAAELPFRTWELLDDRVAEAYGSGEQAAVIQVRAAYVQTLTRRAIEESADDWTATVRWFADGAVAWRLEFCERLMNEVQSAPGNEADHALLARTARLAQEDRWYEADAMFRLLAAQSFLPPTHIARFTALRGLIELFHVLRHERARTFIEEALRIAPDDAGVLTSEAEYLLSRGNVAEARARCQHALELDPRHVATYSTLGDCALAENDVSAAEAWYRHALKERPGHSNAYVRLCRIYAKRAGEPDVPDPLSEWENRVESINDRDAYNFGVAAAMACQERGQTNRAEDWYGRAISRFPRRLWGYLRRGYLRRDQSRFDDARKDFAIAMQLAPEAVDGYLGMAYLHELTKEWSEARRWYRLGIERRPEWEGMIRGRVAIVYAKEGQFQIAEAEALRAIEADPWSANPADPPFYAELLGELADARQWEAARAFVRAMPPRVQEDPAFRSAIALLRNGEANELFARGDYVRAARLYQEAVEYMPSDAVLHSNLASARQHDTTVTDPVQRFEGVRAALAEAVRLDERNREYASRLEMAERLVDLSPIYADCGLERDPIVQPITVEIAFNLIEWVATEDRTGMDAELTARMNALRDRILQRNGVRIPGVKFRDNRSFADNTYAILLMEVPVAMGIVQPEQRFCADPAEEIARRGIEYESSDVPAGIIGSWIAKPHWDAASSAGLDVWQPMECALRHLESILERNLGEVLGLDELDTRMTHFCADLIPSVTAEAGGLALFAGALRALLGERLPIVELRALCERYLDARARGLGETEIVEELRRIVLPPLPSATRQFTLGEELESRVAQRIHRDGARAVLALPPDDFRDLLAAVRERVGDQQGAALVVETPILRPFVQRLTGFAWPMLPVLAREDVR